MIQLLFDGHVLVFVTLLLAIIVSLSFHEFGHAYTAKLHGDDTAEKLGRLTINPVAHIDPMGLLMVATIGFGYAKPVPVTPHKLKYPWSGALVAAAGPFMNLLVAIVAVNLFIWGQRNGVTLFQNPSVAMFFTTLVTINILLMLFNLLPIGPLDGHYIMPWLLPSPLDRKYEQLNAQYGVQVFLILIVLSFLGLPIFRALFSLVEKIIPYIVFV